MKLTQAHPDIASHLGALTPIAPKLETLRIVGFDTEDNTRGTPISFAFHDGQTPFYTTNVEEAIDYIYNYEETACFVAHNLEYDIGNLFKKCNYKYCRELIYASKLLHVRLYGTKNFFINSSSFFQGALSKMGKLIGKEKLEGDVFNPEYNITDAHIPQIFITQMQTRLHALGINLGLSVGQIAMGVYRRNFLRGRIHTFNHPDVLKAYYGGRVEVFFKGVVQGPLYNADINSSYPDVMRHKPFPDTSQMERSRIDSHRFGVGEFRVLIPKDCFIPPLPFRSENGRLFFPTGEVTGNFTYAEVRKAVAIGCTILGEKEGWGTNSTVYPFREFVDQFWDLRQVVKKNLEHDTEKTHPLRPTWEFESLFLKLIMNNLYGKFAQHKDAVKMLRVRMSENKLRKLKGVRENKIGPFYGYTIPKEKAPRNANYLWGVYITAYARLSLFEKLQAVHAAGGTLVYCDTDSIMFTGAKAKAALKFGDALGEMSLETFDLGVFRLAKGYLLCNEVRRNRVHLSKGRLFVDGQNQSRGVSLQACNARFRQLRDAKEYVIKKVACKGVPTHMALPFLRDGITEFFRKPMRLKEALLRVSAKANKNKPKAFFRDIGVNVWKDVQKTMNGVYIKRLGEAGVTTPIDVADIPEAEKNAYAEPSPMEAMRHLLITSPIRKEKFLNIKIPRGWFKRKNRFTADEKFFLSQDIHFLQINELSEINEGEAWFKGNCINRKKGKYGDYFIFFVKEFLGADVSRKKFMAALPEKFLEGVPEEKIIGKYLEIILESAYIKNSEPHLAARVG